jgi:hypothetical protein
MKMEKGQRGNRDGVLQFSQIITGSKTIHKQLDRLTDLAEQILSELKRQNPLKDK